jgi:hypothetical protein
MKRGVLIAAVVAVEALIAAACAAAFGLAIALATGYAQRSGYWHGGGPPASTQERAEVHAAGLYAFLSTFGVVLVGELALTAGVLLLVRRAGRHGPIGSVAQGTIKPRPLGVWFIAASFSYSVCAGLALAFCTYFLGTLKPTDYVLGVQVVAGIVGLRLALTRQPVPRIAAISCAVLLCVIAYFTIPPFGPSLIIWPIVLMLLLANDSVRDHFDHSQAALSTASPGRR